MVKQPLKRTVQEWYSEDVMSPSHWESTDPQRRKEMRDFDSINEDHNAIANLPMEPMIKKVYQP